MTKEDKAKVRHRSASDVKDAFEETDFGRRKPNLLLNAGKRLISPVTSLFRSLRG